MPTAEQLCRTRCRRVARAMWLYVGLPYLAVTLIFFALQRQLIYRPSAAADLSVAACRLPADAVQDVRLEAQDGVTLKGWLLRARGRPQAGKSPLVLYFPGNAGHRFGRLSDLQEFAAAGWDVLIFDYRGYGDSGGSPAESALESDAQQIWQYARNSLGYDEQRIVVFGESLGGAVALSLWKPDREDAAVPQPTALMLNSTFTTMPEVVAWHYPWFPFRWLLWDRWPSAERIPRVTVLTMIFHGTDDEFVPFAQGQRLASLAAKGRFVKVEGGVHNSIPLGQVRRELEQLFPQQADVEQVAPTVVE